MQILAQAMKQNIFLLLTIFLFTSCKKNESSQNAYGQDVIHGNITLTINAMHHSWPVSNIGVHLVKDATSFPGIDTTKYQIHTITDLTGNAFFQNLFPGNYYVYASGFDSNFGTNVTGYSPITVNSSSDNQSEFTLYVSE